MARLSGTRKGQIRKTSRRAYTPKRRTTTRRRRTTKKGMLSELFNPKMSSAGAKTVLSGAVGGIGAGLLDKVLESNVKRFVAIGSGKGGVGKSTTSVNLAIALKLEGYSVGLLDADVYGPSLPKLINLNEKPKSDDGKAITPLEKYDVQFMSMGFLVDEQTPMIWRGPMVISAIKTMTQKVLWKDRDIIIIDMPPGTGDAQLTFAQEVKIDGAIIVSTPQDLALLDVKRGTRSFSGQIAGKPITHMDPMTGPISVPRPPMTTIETTLSELLIIKNRSVKGMF